MLIAILLIPVLLYGLIHNHHIQNHLVHHVTAYMSRELGVEISVGSIDLRLFRTLVLRDFLLYDREGELLVDAPELMVNVGDISFRNRSLVVRKLKLSQTGVYVVREEQEPDYNFQFVLDYFSSQNPGRARRDRWHITVASFELIGVRVTHKDYHVDVPEDLFHPARLDANDIYLAVRDIHLSDTVLAFELDYLHGKESSGMHVNYLSGSFSAGKQETVVRNMLLRMDSTNLNLDIWLGHEQGLAESLATFTIPEFSALIRNSDIDLTHIVYLLPQMQGLSGQIKLAGDLSGDGDRIEGNSVSMTYGVHSGFYGSFELADYASLKNLHGEVFMDQLHTSAGELEAFTIPGEEGPFSLQFPAEVHRLGMLHASGSLKGSFYDLIVTGEIKTDIGDILTRMTLSMPPENNDFEYQGELRTIGFHAGYFAGIDRLLGKLDMDLQIDGRGTSMDDLRVAVLGTVHGIDILGYDYRNIDFEGNLKDRQLRSYFITDDPNVYLDFRATADLQAGNPYFDVRVDIDRANLTSLNIFQRDSLYASHVSMAFDMQVQGQSLNDLAGELYFRNLQYGESALNGDEDPKLLYATDSIYINSTVWGQDSKHLRIRSDFMDADAYGSIFYDQLLVALTAFSQSYLPALYPGNNDSHDPAIFHQDLSFSFRMKETNVLTELFLPVLSLGEGAWVNGIFDSKTGNLEIQSQANLLIFGGNRFRDLEFQARPLDEAFHIELRSDKLLLSDSLHLDQLYLSTSLFSDTVSMTMNWKDPDGENGPRGNLAGLLRIYNARHAVFSFLPSEAFINGDLWEVSPDNQIIFDSARVEFNQLMIYHEDQFIELHGALSADPKDKVTISFSQFDVAYTDILMGHRNFKFGGLMDGYAEFSAIYQPFSIGANIFIDGFAFNGHHLGDMNLQSIWDPESEAFQVDGLIMDHSGDEPKLPLSVTGAFYPGDRADNFAIDFELQDMTLEVWSTYMRGFTDEFRGVGTGRLHLGGGLQDPELTGKVMAVGSGFFIPYLNNSYSFTHEVEFAKYHFGFENMALYDTLGNSAQVTGQIMHQAFKDFAVDVRLQPDRMLIFNTTSRHNQMFYGQAFVSGLAHIYGPVNNIVMDISARTNRGTRIFLPLNQTGDIRESHFISFVSKTEAYTEPAFASINLPGGVAVNFDLEVTPEAEVQLMFDSQFGDVIRGRGAGDLRMEVSPQGAFNIYGDYIIDDGEYFFNLQNIINKRFRIAQGGHIRWSGDLNEADVELEASYRIRTPLYDLLGAEGMASDMAEAYRRRTQVETILILEDKLFNPLISFDIRVPGGDEATRDLIERVITTEQEMNRQVFSLLVLNRFMPTTADQYNTALGYGVGNTSSELLSNQLSNWLTQISSDFDIGINYRPGDEITSQEVELALSTQLFDDRVTIDGNFGVAGNQTATGHSTQGANQIIGDVNIEVKITPEGKFRVKAFNRSNTFDIINTNAPYTQGIGIFYRREFDSLQELFRRSVRSE